MATAIVVLVAIGMVVWLVRPFVRLAEQRRSAPPMLQVVGLAEAIGGATSLAEVEKAVAQEIIGVLGANARWAVLTSRFEFDHDAIDPSTAREIRRILAAHPDGEPVPWRLPVRVGEAAAVPCGAGSDLVLVVAAAELDPKLDPALSQIAVFAGFGARMIAAADRLAVQRTEARYEEIVRYATDAILVSDANGRLTYVAPSATVVLGYRASEMEGQLIIDLLGTDRAGEIEAFLAEASAKGARAVTERTLDLHRADGTLIHVDVVAANLLDNDQVRGIVINLRDVTDRRRLEDQLRDHALHDGVTGLANRTLFVDRVRLALRARRTAADPQPCVAVVHLAGFGAVNVTHGTDAGDQVLREVGGRLSDLLRGDDTIARIGSSDFALVLVAVADGQVADLVLRRAVAAVSAPVILSSGAAVSPSATVGAAIATADERDPELLLRRAETASHRARRTGGRKVEVDDAAPAAGPRPVATDFVPNAAPG